VARELARKGDVAGALELAESFTTSQERLEAIDSIANVVQDGRAVR